jgi:hypothetical protein
MWKLPLFGCTDSAQVLKEVEECKKEYPGAGLSPDDLAEDLGPLFEAIIRCVPGPNIEKDGALQMLVSYSDFLLFHVLCVCSQLVPKS